MFQLHIPKSKHASLKMELAKLPQVKMDPDGNGGTLTAGTPNTVDAPISLRFELINDDHAKVTVTHNPQQVQEEEIKRRLESDIATLLGESLEHTTAE